MMSSTGGALQLSLFGESHGPAVGCTLTGLAPGIPLTEEELQLQLDKRRPRGKTGTARREADRPRVLSGLYNGCTTGTPLTIVIENGDTHSGDYQATQDLARPSHADYTGRVKYQCFNDPRGGGHFSGRLTAPMVAAGAIFIKILALHGIALGTHIVRLGGVEDADFSQSESLLRREIDGLNEAGFPCICGEAAAGMQAAIEAAAREGDSVGGILETAVCGLEAGVGEPIFDSVESVLAHLLYSIPGVKGVEFGLGFGFAGGRGSLLNDPFCIRQGQVATTTNHSGGINGGITNGMPLIVRTALRPTPSIYKEQSTVNMSTGEESSLVIHGRHDPAIVHRARVVADSMVAFGLVDLYSRRYGYLWQNGGSAER